MVAVGAVGTRSVRLWARAPGARRLSVELHAVDGPPHAVSAVPVEREIDPRADHTVAFDLPKDAPGFDALEPDRGYRVLLRELEGALIGEASFRTAAEDVPERYAFAIASCHQPFTRSGHLVAKSVRMLASAPRALQRFGARFLVQMGDQIYADYPDKLSLFGDFFRTVAPVDRESIFACTRDEIRRLYHERHRIYFGVEPFRDLLASIPSYPILDDHEIRDNYGSAPEHASPAWRAVLEGARDAFYDYQASRVLPQTSSSFHYGFVHGPCGVFVMDLRSQRRTDNHSTRSYTDAQLEDLVRFLAEHAHLPVVAVVVSLPIAYLTERAAEKMVAVAGESSDAGDRWSKPGAVAQRDRLLRALRAHQRAAPEQRLVLLSGDIHVGSLFRIRWRDGLPPVLQFTSSALSNLQPRVARWVAEEIPKVITHVAERDELEADVEIVPDARQEGMNPYGGLNLGIIEVVAATRQLRFRLVGEPDRRGNHRIAYDSGYI